MTAPPVDRRTADTNHLPPRSDWLFRQLRDWVAVPYIRKHCHALRVSLSSAALPLDGQPVLVAMNHPSWWDPLTIFAVGAEFPGHFHYGVMDAEALKKYSILKKAGVFGVENGSVRGAAEFLRRGTAVMKVPKNVFWVTAQGEFADVRRRPVGLRSGVGHLAARLDSGWVLPIAVEMCFWNERTPEILVRYGDPLPLDGKDDAKTWCQRIEDRLATTMDALAADAVSRDAKRFRILVSGKVGVGGVYDGWRRIGATLRGRRFDPSHDEVRR